MSTFRIAAAQYPVGFLASWEAYTHKIVEWVEEAAANQAQILLFPEYASMELASLFPPSVYASLPGQLEAMQSLLPEYLQLYRTLAGKYSLYIQAGTFPVLDENQGYRNRAYFFAPDGWVDFQEKLMMTRFENEQWLIEAGQKMKLFSTPYGKVGICVCYDSEFPHYARTLVEQGASLLLVPSCTDTRAGYNRVRIGCRARALENQCYVVQSPLIGEAEWSEAVDTNCGAAGVFTPVDKGFPADGVLAQGEYNQPQWVFADLDLEKIEHVRYHGQVFNYRDWPYQFNATLESQ